MSTLRSRCIEVSLREFTLNQAGGCNPAIYNLVKLLCLLDTLRQNVFGAQMKLPLPFIS